MNFLRKNSTSDAAARQPDCDTKKAKGWAMLEGDAVILQGGQERQRRSFAGGSCPVQKGSGQFHDSPP